MSNQKKLVEALRRKYPDEVTADVEGSSDKYGNDWETWLNTDDQYRPELFVKLLGKWQAARPRALRRLKQRAHHAPPYMEELLDRAKPFLQAIQHLTMIRVKNLSYAERKSITGLWEIFSAMTQIESASCVGISKAVMLLSNGRIGPAFDSMVRKKLGISHLLNANEWISALQGVSCDIEAFEIRHGVRLNKIMPARFQHLEYGRLYDMVFGPR